jgi:hypothetical protein
VKYNKIVVKFKDNKILKGTIDNWSSNKTQFFMQTLEGQTVNIKLDHLKAVFFVKDFIGNKDRKNIYNDHLPGEGVKISATFLDGEVIVGYSLSYSPSRLGFTMTPADKNDNNTRIFVVQSATREVASMLL